MAELAVLLRNGKHYATTGGATIRYALKCDQVAIQFAKTPIQIPVPQQSPELLDFGIVRPAITISGLVDTIGGNTANTLNNVEGMESFTFTRDKGPGTTTGSNASQIYYIPYKNRLEDFVTDELYKEGNEFEIEIGNALYQVYSGVGGTWHSTGGSIYRVSLQQARFQVDPSKEDRYTFTIQFVATTRMDTEDDYGDSA